MADDVKVKKKKKAKAKQEDGVDEEIPLEKVDSGSARFDQLLQKAVTQATEGAKKKKKKKGDAESDAVLESLRKGEGLTKEEDAAIKANTYDPDNSPKNEKSNKRKQKLQQKGKDNTAYERDVTDVTDKPLKKKQKELKSEVIDTSLNATTVDKTVTMSELEATPTKKKKKKKPPDEEDTQPLSPSEDAPVKSERKKKKKEAVVVDEPPSHEEVPKSAKQKKKKKDEEEKVEETEVLSDSTPKKKKVKKGEKDSSAGVSADEEATSSKSKKKKSEDTVEEEVTSPKSAGKKKKKKGASSKDEEEEEVLVEDVQKTEKKKKKVKDKKEEEDRPMSPTEEEPSVKEKVKKKKKKKNQEEESGSRPMSPETEEEAPTEEAKPKGKKKKKTKKEGDEEEDVISKEEGEEADEEKEEEETEVKQKPKKKGKKKAIDECEATAEEMRLREERAMIEDEGEVLAVTIHRTDKLKNDFHIMHPLVRVHIVDEDTGQYLEKQHKDRAVISYFETQAENVERILPIMTQPFDFKKEKSVLPVWEELLLFNENFNYFINTNPKVIVFFELLDFVSMNTASRHYSSDGSQGGWHKIGWAFLKIRGSNGKVNAGAKVRLQLFVPPGGSRPKSDQTEIYHWWKSGKRETYPSTLYVTLKGIHPEEKIDPSTRSMFAIQEEVGTKSYQDLKKSITWKDKTHHGHHKTLASWTRLAGQTCRIPNNQLATLPSGSQGCFTIKFSHDGRNLACGCRDKDQFPILIYEVPSFELKGKLRGHFNIVYDLDWSKRDTHLISASADGTARVWDIEDLDKWEKLLPHPAYVYTAKFHPRVDNIVATGGYDQVIRVWDIGGEETHGNLKQELEDHRGHVNSLCFDSDGEKMYSGDSAGNIIIWNVYVSEKATYAGFLRDWTLFKKLSDPEFKDTPINHIQLHHNGRRLLVHCRDNIIRLLDLRVQRVMQKYIGALNFRERIRSTLTPCGTFVFSGSEDNSAYAWNTETGDQVAMYSELNYKHPVTDIDYHPRDHLMALCCLGDNQPILIYNYNSQIAQIDAGLSPRHIMTEPRIPEDNVTLIGSPRKGEETMATLGSGQIMTKEEFQVAASARYEKVLKKLHSATAQMASTPGIDVPGTVTPRMAHTGFTSLDTSATPRAMMARPQAFSPHAPHTMSSIMQQQQFASTNLYLKSSGSDWRPGFSEVGRHGARSSSPTFIGRPPTITLSQQHGKTQFSFQAPAGKAVPSYKQVVALYDYRAQRSDELSIFKGDVISVLYKDNDQWWMGELPDGQQGFFPASYVAEEIHDSDDNNGPPSDDSSDDTSKKKKKKLTAVKTKDGELKFVSGNEESDDDLLHSTRGGMEDTGSDNGATNRRNRNRRRKESTA